MSPARTPRHRIALIGNPNTGKTTLFNALTGLSRRVGNFPGVTVEIQAGHAGGDLEILDLPGAYSLAAQSADEMLVIDLLLGRRAGEPPVDLVAVTVDASNLRRNLYLTTQVMELGLPVVVALNMMDMAGRSGMLVDAAGLSGALGIPVVPVVATRGTGVEELLRTIRHELGGGGGGAGRGAGATCPRWRWPEPIVRETERLRGSLGDDPFLVRRALIDEGGVTERALLENRDGAARRELARARARLESGGRSAASLEAHMRYAWIGGVLEEALTRHPAPEPVSRAADRFLTHRLAGLAIFAVIMGCVFLGVFQLAAPFVNAISWGLDGAASAVAWLARGTPFEGGVLQSLVVDGILGGVGAVLTFVPQIAILFLFVAILEDCGYMARAAFLMDRALRFCGLSGHSFIPMLGSFACAVPGILAARTIRSRRDRLTTILVAPLMSCSARIPVYAIMIAAFVPKVRLAGFAPLQGVVFGGMYLLGILVAIPVALLLKWTVLRGESSTFVLELPPYRLPQAKTVVLRVFQAVRSFVQRAGTIIFALSIVIWSLGYFPRSPRITEAYASRRATASRSLRGPDLERRLAELDGLESAEHLRNSVLGRMGRILEPAVAPLGWDWTIGVAALSAFPARELLVSTLSILVGLGREGTAREDTDLGTRLRQARRPDGSRTFTLPVALSILVFVALCCQCASTLVMIRREAGSWRWPLLTFTYMTALAYAGAFATFRIATALGA